MDARWLALAARLWRGEVPVGKTAGWRSPKVLVDMRSAEAYLYCLRF